MNDFEPVQFEHRPGLQVSTVLYVVGTWALVSGASFFLARGGWIPRIVLTIGCAVILYVLAVMRTYAGPQGVVVDWGMRKRTIPWSEVEAFCYVSEPRPGTYLSLRSGEAVRLPLRDHPSENSDEPRRSDEVVATLNQLLAKYRS